MGCESKKDIKELEELKKELVKEPKNVELLLKIGMLLFDPFMDMDQGLPYFEKAMKLEPKNPDLPFWAGYALYHDQCAYQEAKKLFERAISLDSDRAEFHYMMFYVLWDITKKGEKINLKPLFKAIELQSGWLKPREQYITCLIMNNEFDLAEKELAEAYRIIEVRKKNRKKTCTNILEKYYYGNSCEGLYDSSKSSLDYTKKELAEKKKKFNS